MGGLVVIEYLRLLRRTSFIGVISEALAASFPPGFVEKAIRSIVFVYSKPIDVLVAKGAWFPVLAVRYAQIELCDRTIGVATMMLVLMHMMYCGFYVMMLLMLGKWCEYSDNCE